MFYPHFHIASVLPNGQEHNGRFYRIRFICPWSTERVIPEIPDRDEIDSADKDACVREPVGNRFMVSIGMVSPSRFFDLLNKSVGSRLGMGNVTERHKNHIAEPVDDDNIFTFRNIDTNSVHDKDSFEMN